MSKLGLLAAGLFLAACGVTETATSAATVAKLSADQAKEVQHLQQKMRQDLAEINKANDQRQHNLEKSQ